MKVDIVQYEDIYKPALEKLLKEFSNEVFECGTVNIDQFIQNHWVIYLALGGDEVIGFASFYYNTYFGLRPPTIAHTYLYVKPAYRRGRASYLLSKQAAFVSIKTNLPLENYYATEDSRRIGQRMKGTHLFDAHLYEVDEVKKAYNKLKI